MRAVHDRGARTPIVRYCDTTFSFTMTLMVMYIEIAHRDASKFDFLSIIKQTLKNKRGSSLHMFYEHKYIIYIPKQNIDIHIGNQA